MNRMNDSQDPPPGLHYKAMANANYLYTVSLTPVLRDSQNLHPISVSFWVHVTQSVTLKA